MTIKGRRINAGVLLDFLKRGRSAEELAEGYQIPLEAVLEVEELGRHNEPSVFERSVISPRS